MKIDQTDCHIRAFYNTVTDDRSALDQLGFMRTLATKAFEHLCRTDTKCASIAVRRGWLRDDEKDPQRGWGDRCAVAETIRRVRIPMPKSDGIDKAALAAIKAALTRYAPENLDLIEPTK